MKYVHNQQELYGSRCAILPKSSTRIKQTTEETQKTNGNIGNSLFVKIGLKKYIQMNNYCTRRKTKVTMYTK